MAPGQQVAHQFTRTHLLEHFKAQGLAKLAVVSQLLYAQGHQRFLSSFDTTIRLVIVYQKMNLSSYLNGIAHYTHYSYYSCYPGSDIAAIPCDHAPKNLTLTRCQVLY